MDKISNVRQFIPPVTPQKTKEADGNTGEVQDKISLGEGFMPVSSYNVSMPSGDLTNYDIKTLENEQPAAKTVSMNMTAIPMFEENISGSVNYRSGINDNYLLRDGFDSSRDIDGISAQEGKPNEPYTFKIHIKDLQAGAETGNLDTYLLIGLGKDGKTALPDGMQGTAQPWNIAIGAYDGKNFNIYDEKGTMDKGLLKKLNIDSLHNTVEFALDKSALREKGWKDGEPLKLQPFTAKDMSKQVTDSIDDPYTKPWAQGGKLSAFAETKGPGEQPNDWRDDIIYFLMTDRFNDADKTNNMDVNKMSLDRYHGGDLQGLIDKLDYIKETGSTAIWLTPTMQNQKTFVDKFDGYHGYWPVDFFNVDKHLGDMGKFEELVKKSHEKGIKVLLDIPLNHVAWEHNIRINPEQFLKDVQKLDIPEELKPKTVDEVKGWLHNKPDIQNWDDPHEAETGGMFGLPDLAQENPKVTAYLKAVSKFWIDKGIDGFRLDAVKNIHFPFFQDFDKWVHEYAGKDFFLIGECFSDKMDKVNEYQKSDMNSLFDYPLYFGMINTLAKDGSMKELAGKLAEADNKYYRPDEMGVFDSNHDTVRFLSQAGGNKEKLKLALAFEMSIDRIPVVYYGTEVGMDNTKIDGEQSHGGWAETSRNDMQWDKDPGLLNYYKTLTSARNDSIALRQGKRLEMWVDDQVFCYGRSHPDQEAVVVLNNSYDSQTRDIPVRPESNLKEGTRLKDALTGQEVVVKDGKIHCQTGGKQAQIFLPV